MVACHDSTGETFLARGKVTGFQSGDRSVLLSRVIFGKSVKASNHQDVAFVFCRGTIRGQSVEQQRSAVVNANTLNESEVQEVVGRRGYLLTA